MSFQSRMLVGLCAIFLLTIGRVETQAQVIPDETFGYVDITSDSHMFYWMYGKKNINPQDRWSHPLVLWSNGGPGGSSFNGDYMEVGPLDVELKVRNYTWANEANLLFVDQPVGTGYSYVDNDDAYVTTKEQINEHLLILLQNLVNRFPALKRTPLYLFGQSYGGKVMADFGAFLYQAIMKGLIDINFKGVALGDPWIYPLGMVSTYGPWLQSLSQLDLEEVKKVDEYAAKMKDALDQGQNVLATKLWSVQQSIIVQMTGGVDFYDYTKNSKPSDNRLQELMDSEEIRSKYGVPSQVRWGSQRSAVFDKLENEFMLDCLDSIDYLLNQTNVDVNIYNGSFDLIVDTPGVKLAVSKLKWEGLESWKLSPRVNFRINGVVEGNKKCHDRLCTYYFLNSGHSAPADNPYMGVEMLRDITSQ